MNVNTINSTSFIEQPNRSQTLERTDVKQGNSSSTSGDTFTKSSNSDSFTTYSANGTLNTDLIEIGDTLNAKRRSSKIRPLI